MSAMRFAGCIVFLLIASVAVSAQEKVESVVVMPLANFTGIGHVENPLTFYVTSALRQQTAFEVFHLQEVIDCLEYYDEFDRPLPPEEKALLLAGRLGADVVVYGSVDEYSGYYPYRLGLSVSVVRVATGEKLFSGDTFYDAPALASPGKRSFKTSIDFNRYACARFVKEVFNPLAMEGERKRCEPFWRRLLQP